MHRPPRLSPEPVGFSSVPALAFAACRKFPDAMKCRARDVGGVTRQARLGPRQDIRQASDARWPGAVEQLPPARPRDRRHCQQRVEQRGKPHRQAHAVNQHDRGVQGLDRKGGRLLARQVDQDQLPAMIPIQRYGHPVSSWPCKACPAQCKLVVPDGKGAGSATRRAVAQRLAIAVMGIGVRHGQGLRRQMARRDPCSRTP